MIPGQSPNKLCASDIAAVSAVVKLRPSPLQTTCIPGPAAMRASNANPTTIIKSPQAPHFTDRDRTQYPELRQKFLPLAAPTHPPRSTISVAQLCRKSGRPPRVLVVHKWWLGNLTDGNHFNYRRMAISRAAVSLACIPDRSDVLVSDQLGALSFHRW